MNEAHEDHLYILVCIDRLSNAWQTLKTIEESGNHPLIGPAFRYALVEYATPFTRSDGPLKKRRTLHESLIPSSMRELHQRIVTARNQLHAHADLVALEAEIYIQYINGVKHVGRVQNYIHGLEEMKNIAAITLLIEGVLDNLYTMHHNSKDTLLP